MPVFGVEDFDDLPAPFNLQELITLLNGALDGNRVSDWMQTGRTDVGTGICMGMCLDWIRRILTGITRSRVESRQSALSSTSTVFSSPKNSYRWDEQKKTHAVYGRAQATTVGAHRMQIETQTAIQQIRLADPLLAHVNTLQEAEQIARQGPPDMDMVRWQAMEDGVVNALQGMRARLGQPPDPREALRLRLQNQSQILEELARLDPQIIPGYSIFKKTRTHSFAGLRIVGNSQQLIQNPLIESAFLRFVQAQLMQLEAGHSGVLSMGMLGGAGHDVAFYRGPGFYCYLDPNLGEFYFGANEWSDLGRLQCASWRAIYGTRTYDWLSWTTYASRT